MEVSLREFSKAKKGDILVYDGKKWQPIPSEDLTKQLGKRIDELAQIIESRNDIDRIRVEKEKATRYSRHFSKGNFVMVFESVRFLLVAGMEDGGIENVEDFLSLKNEVLENRVSVEVALNKYVCLKNEFTKIFGELED